LSNHNDAPIIDVIIPAYNEEQSIAYVVKDIPKSLVRHILVCNNGSTDNTAVVAENEGAIVLEEPKSGYGSACLKGINHIKNAKTKPDIAVFIDGDYSDYPEQMEELIKPIVNDNYDLVSGRVL